MSLIKLKDDEVVSVLPLFRQEFAEFRGDYDVYSNVRSNLKIHLDSDITLNDLILTKIQTTISTKNLSQTQFTIYSQTLLNSKT